MSRRWAPGPASRARALRGSAPSLLVLLGSVGLGLPGCAAGATRRDAMDVATRSRTEPRDGRRAPAPRREQDEDPAPAAAARPESGTDALPAAAEVSEDEDGEPDPVSFADGFLALRYRGRWGAGERDHDLYATLDVAVGDPARDRVTYHVLGRSALDLGPDEPGSPVFFSLADTYESDLTAQLDRAYAEVHRVEGLTTLRLGRQLLVETPELVHLDGLFLETAPRGGREVLAGLYGGVPAHLYESSGRGDLVVGTYVEARPWPGGRARADWMHLEDENLLGPHRDDLWAAGLWQALGERVDVETQYSQVESDPRDVRAAAHWIDPERDLVLDLSYYRLLATQRDLAVPLDPFYAALRELFPFDQVGFLASKGFACGLRLDGGVDVRRVDDEQDVGEFNRDFDRYHLTLVVLEELLPVRLSLTGDVWNSDGNDVRTWGADVARDWSAWSASLGSYYSLFKYDLFTEEEKDHVRTWYMRLRRSVRGVGLDLRYEFEDSDPGDFHRLTVGATWRF